MKITNLFCGITKKNIIFEAYNGHKIYIMNLQKTTLIAALALILLVTGVKTTQRIEVKKITLKETTL